MPKDSNFTNQAKILISKNLKSIKRSKSSFYFLILTPIIAVLFTKTVDKIVRDALESYTVKDFPVEEISKIPKCKIGKGKSKCVTLGYYIIGKEEPYIREVMESVSQKNGLEYGKDVKLMGVGTARLYKEMVKRMENETQSVVVFCNSNWEIELPTMPGGSKFFFNIDFLGFFLFLIEISFF